MNDDKLKQALDELQVELINRDELTDDQVARLKQLRIDIDDFLQRQTDVDIARDFGEKILAMEADFSVKHPVLDAVFVETLNTLNRIGV